MDGTSSPYSQSPMLSSFRMSSSVGLRLRSSASAASTRGSVGGMFPWRSTRGVTSRPREGVADQGMVLFWKMALRKGPGSKGRSWAWRSMREAIIMAPYVSLVWLLGANLKRRMHLWKDRCWVGVIDKEEGVVEEGRRARDGYGCVGLVWGLQVSVKRG